MSEEHEVQLQVNDPIKVTIEGLGHQVPTTCVSRIQETRGGDYLIAWSADVESKVPVNNGDVVLMSFLRRGSVYSIDACVVSRSQGPMPLLTVRPMGSARRIQRREYVRIPAEFEVELAARGDATACPGREPINQAQITARTIDLSGGGFAIRHSSALPQGTLFDVKIKIPGRAEQLNMTAMVVQCDPLTISTTDHSHKIGFAFMRQSEAVRRHVMSLIIQLQQEYRPFD